MSTERLDDAQFWRNFSALSRYARPQDMPPLRNLRGRGLVLPIFIPTQRSAPPGVPAKPRTKWGSR